MSLAGLVEILSTAEEFQSLVQGLRNGYREQGVSGLGSFQKALLIASLFAQSGLGGNLLAVSHNAYEGERLFEDLVSILGEDRVAYFPPLEVLPHEEITQDPDLLVQRLRVYERLLNPADACVVVAPVQALCRRLAPPQVMRNLSIPVVRGKTADLEELAGRLVLLGYERVDMVEGRGQFAVRGGLLDVFPMTHDNPYRIEFWGDEVDSIRTFDSATQRSVAEQESVWLVPARETVFARKDAEAAAERVEAAWRAQAAKLGEMGRREAERKLREKVAGDLEALLERHYFPGVEQFLPFLYPELSTFLEYLPGALVVLDEAARIREAAESAISEIGESLVALVEKGGALAAELDLFLDWPDLYAAMTAGPAQHPVVHLSLLAKRVPGAKLAQSIVFPARTPEPFHGKLERLAVELKEWRTGGYRALLAVQSLERAKRLQSGLTDHGLSAVVTDTVTDQLKPGNVVVAPGGLSAGGEFPHQKLVVLSDLEIFGRPRRRRLRPVEEGVRLAAFADLRVGDYVVHTNHGIGQYLGVETKEVAGVHRDYCILRYAGEDRLFVPTEQVNQLQRYIGVEGVPPKLSRLGGAEWTRVKNRVKESVRDLAENLLKLYAERETVKGHAFATDTPWQREFEETFPYEETPDQTRAIQEVKRDMERVRPMDRLVCGDVGYGKTEVAIRAAFKAVNDSKQVAVLVPTTILAQQHYQTFTERFGGFPLKVEVMSRFQTPREQADISKRVAKGEVDVLIGTHRLLSSDVRFKDLGLVIVDEEQRFGVAQKERLKELRKNVDVVTLTATPIPRTLHMAMAGVRDMSVIETPPEGRYPIRTYVMEYSDQAIREAVLRELGRKGQVYFVYNRVQTIDHFAGYLSQLIPEARVVVAHGQMDEGRLEQVMLDFLEGEFDILLCTTIIESGLDIPNVNTLIVYDADRLGLAQLYQLRGRVGRSNRVAYAYFTFRRDKVMTEEAEKRLAAIKEFTELGSGFKIAMRDLEIRGAGNILGPEQHGFIASVGFELYCRLLEDTVRELKGEVKEEIPDPSIDLPVDAYLPDEYVRDAKQKVEIYKKVITIAGREDSEDLTDELVDRFGEPPAAVVNLLTVARIKAIARDLRVTSIGASDDALVIRFDQNHRVEGVRLAQAMQRYRGHIAVTMTKAPQIRFKLAGRRETAMLQLLEALLGEIRG